MCAERVTIMLNSNISKKVHALQAKEISKSSKSVSFSSVINDVLDEGLKKYKV